ncbi:hypothetical protein [Limnoglobus roseus]|uniref:Fibronectin type-III domain-containing protein n=1 Tax=Limnoglobus roseus TaxID=2598579 RepID=A0A5C1APJ5_9BACT|nr:hypothetical protein [Limnoglobus roseus]QEL21091.1 hypothetical protein PX52LOC_08220 [Limnoglobus roseus]
MRRLLSLVTLALGPAAFAQDTRYSPQLDIGFPVPAAVKDLNPKPAKLRLYASVNRGPFTQVSERGINDLAPIAGRQPGFIYSAKADGEEEFAVQLVYADGTVSPAVEKLRTDSRVIFDTRPPAVTVSADGAATVTWSAQDENLDADGILLECKWQNGDAKWHEVPKPRSGFAARDKYTWAGLTRESRTLEVRVTATDKAGHKTSSRVVRLPSSGTDSPRGGDDVEVTPRRAAGPVGISGRLTDDVPGQPQILYFNKRDLTIKSKLQTVTRSGVVAVHLFAKQLSANPNGNWIAAKKQACNIAYQEPNPAVEIPFTAPEDGRYGFIVIPENGAGNRDRDPASTALAQHLVEVDTKAPVVKIRRAIPTPGGSTGTRLEIEWDADDLNLMTDPIVIEYAADKTAKDWVSVAERIPNSRRYVWDVPDKTPFKVYLKVRATDKATNTGEAISVDPIIIDLDKPSAVIETVQTAGGLSPTGPGSIPTTPTERPPPSASPPSSAPPPPSSTPILPVPTGGVPDTIPKIR